MTKSEPAAIATLDDALQRCQALGMRLSRQRRFILALLWESREHLTAKEIYDRLSREGKQIGHTSVYQNLDALASQGLIECVERSDGRLYGNVTDTHSHVNCLDTNEIIDVRIELPPEMLQFVEQQTGRKIVDYRVEFFGRKQTP